MERPEDDRSKEGEAQVVKPGEEGEEESREDGEEDDVVRSERERLDGWEVTSSCPSGLGRVTVGRKVSKSSSDSSCSLSGSVGPLGGDEGEVSLLCETPVVVTVGGEDVKM